MLQQLILKILESIGFKILRFKRLPSSIGFQKSKYQIKEFKIFDVWWKFHWILKIQWKTNHGIVMTVDY